MKPGERKRSLFWTFAGVFLLVLILATVLQALVSVAVLRPLAVMNVRDRAELVALRAARELATLPRPAADEAIRRVLRANRTRTVPLVLVYYDGAGRVVMEPPMPPGGGRGVAQLLGGALPTDSSASPPPEFRGGEPPGGGGPPPPDAGRTPGPRGMRMEVLGRRSVMRNGVAVGEVVAIGSLLDHRQGGLLEARAMLLFLPFAVLAAAIAGLLMVRILVRRLRALEHFAERVTGGDLAARVDVGGLDEIGRLEERLNRMTERLAEARDRLEQAETQRSRLLADITHELSTPITSIRGYVETMLDPAVPTSPEERVGYLRDVRDEALRLDLLIRDLFDLVRLEGDASPLSPVRLDWAALCRNTVRRFEARFREGGLTLRWEGNEAEAWVVADGRRLEQVVENLLVNALRYVPAGGTVGVSLVSVDGPAGCRFRLCVRDDGPGIAAEDLPHVFERFYRADAVRSSSGSGLGLAIVHEIVQRHRGEVRVENAVPRGALFIVELPAAEG